MVRLMGEDFNGNSITDIALSKYTAFFNPKSDSVFDLRDWDRINRKPESFYYSYVDKYITQPVEFVNGRRVDRWWDDRDDLASGYCSNCVPVHTVKIPDPLVENGKNLFFGYVP